MTAGAHAINTQLWLRSRSFDLFFILGILALALLCAGLISHDQTYLIPIANLNVLLLATPHFVAAYTRIGFDRVSAKRYRFLITGLPPIILIVVTLIAFSAGGWMVAALYLYWQWWHFMRQDYGISRIYLSRAPSYQPHKMLDNYALYALPLCGILYRSYQQPAGYLGMDIRTLAIPYEIVWLMGIVALLLMIMQAHHWYKSYRSGMLPMPYLLFVLSHYAVFGVCYLMISDINIGWLAFNIWHNLQYISFVWVYNNRRFRAGEIAERSFLGDMSREQTLWAYGIGIVAMAAFLNFCISLTAYEASHLYALLPWVVIVSLSVSFHHYIVDAVVWKRRRRTVYST